MTRILHLLSAYPDPIAPETRASSNLLEILPEMTHHVYSFNRAGWRPGQQGQRNVVTFDDAAGEGHQAIAYAAPPYGIGLKKHLDILADWIGADLDQRGIRPDVIHAHKLSMDGLVGSRLAARLDVPLMISLQANSDVKILRAKRNLRPYFLDIWRQAAVVFPFAPVAETMIADILGPRPGPVVMLPCPTGADAMTPPQIRAAGAAPVIRTAFHIAHYGNKNVKTLIQAIQAAAATVPDIRLEIIGGGDARAFLAVARMADELAPGRVTLLGAVPHARVQALFNQATGFALLSQRESYGMVYAEALLAGTPCLYSAGRAIDGYFEPGGVVLSADPGDLAAITDALVRLCQEEAAFKGRLAEMMAAGGLDILRRDTIAETYRGAVKTAMAEVK